MEPTYFLACRIFADAGVTVRGVPDGERGVDVDVLRKQMEEAERESSVDRPVSTCICCVIGRLSYNRHLRCSDTPTDNSYRSTNTCPDRGQPKSTSTSSM